MIGIECAVWTGKDGKERAGLNVTAWPVERIREIDKNNPAKRRKRRAEAKPKHAALATADDEPI